MNRRRSSTQCWQFSLRGIGGPPLWKSCSLVVMLAASPVAFGQAGGHDYYNPGSDTDVKANMVNAHHFHLQPAFDAMKTGNWRSAWENFEFILRFAPNSPQALNGISQLCVLKWKSPLCDADSWFDQAIAINPSIATTWVLYGIHLQRKKLPDQAVEKFKHALELRPDDINGHYNLGLAYFDMKDYDNANKQAQMSYALGAPLPGLREMLKRVGAWKPSPKADADSAPKVSRQKND